jgi:hypothetical protein
MHVARVPIPDLRSGNGRFRAPWSLGATIALLQPWHEAGPHSGWRLFVRGDRGHGLSVMHCFCTGFP